MRLRGTTFVLGPCVVLLALSLGLGGCSSQGSAACATKVTPEVCATPAQLRGADPVTPTWSSAPAPELVAEPLADGRYVQTALTLYCGANFPLPSEPRASVQAVQEISGCVLRLTMASPSLQEPLVTVHTLRYAPGGTLDLSPACSPDPPSPQRTPYGFDGLTLQLLSASQETGSDGQTYPCQRIDTFELR